VAHAAVIVFAIFGSWRIDGRQGLITIIPPSAPQFHELPPFGGTRRGIGPSGGLGRPLPNAAVPDTTPPVPAPVGKPDTTLAASPVAIGPHIVAPPQVGDGRLWVLPRPALPSEVADALYEPHESRDSTVVRRLKAMVDSLNVVIDQDQRARQRPVWTTDVAGKVFGIDSQYIHVAGIKIPTAALALLQAVRARDARAQAGGARRGAPGQGGHDAREGGHRQRGSLIASSSLSSAFSFPTT
jgi:hypothetical protein